MVKGSPCPPGHPSHAVVEAGLYDTGSAAALALANFTYQPIDELEVACEVKFSVRQVRSAERGKLAFTQTGNRVSFQLPLGISDIIRLD